MAEYDNLLAELRILSRHTDMSSRSELKAKLFEALIAVRALQTENTELRAEKARWQKTWQRADESGTKHANGLLEERLDVQERLAAAERVITEALNVTPLGGSVANLRGVVDEMRFRLSSYPLGEGQTPKPWKCVHDPGCLENPGRHSVRCQFANETRADYEGQTQQGDER